MHEINNYEQIKITYYHKIYSFFLRNLHLGEEKHLLYKLLYDVNIVF